MQLSFFGATQTVTGSRYLLKCGERRVLVDCGLFQGYKHLRLKNWSRLPFTANEVDVVLLTHAHLDHSGYLPLLVKSGFKGPIYATKATLELCRILLPDSGHLQEEQAQFANRHSFSKHSPALPLYTEQDAYHCLKNFRTVTFEEDVEPAPGVRATFTHAGHLLGAASVRVRHGGRSILFSGDVGRSHDSLMRAPAAPVAADAARLWWRARRSSASMGRASQSGPKWRSCSPLRRTPMQTSSSRGCARCRQRRAKFS